jgi:ABC-type spermidine/putrescine transport systems, ATPase components
VNVFDARLVARTADGARVVVDGLGEIVVPGREPPAEVVALAVRPEKMEVSTEGPASGPLRLAGRIGQIAYFGDHSRIFVDSDGRRLVCIRHNRSRIEPTSLEQGMACYVSFRPEDAILLSS